jgi:hypothetical protein
MLQAKWGSRLRGNDVSLSTPNVDSANKKGRVPWRARPL